MEKEIERLERQAAIDAELNKPTSHPITNQPGKGNGGRKTGRASAAYKTAFWNAMKRKIILIFRNALQVGTDSEGGLFGPPMNMKELWWKRWKKELFPKSGKTVIQASSGDRKIPIVASKEKQSGLMKKRHIQNLMTALDRFPLVHIRLRP